MSHAQPLPADRPRPGHLPFGAAGAVGALGVAHLRTNPPQVAALDPTAAGAPGLPPACLVALLDELDTGVLLCGAGAEVLLLNEAARRELADGGVLQRAPDGSLAVAGGSGLLLLRRAVHNAAFSGLRQLVPLRVGDRALMVAVQPLLGAPQSPPCAVLLLGRRQLCPDLAVQMLGRLYDLTWAEQSVLTSLLHGARVAALAKARGVAVSTVRTQVAALRAKFGVRRVDDITRLVAEMPPMVSALRSPLASTAPLAAAGGGCTGGTGGHDVRHR